MKTAWRDVTIALLIGIIIGWAAATRLNCPRHFHGGPKQHGDRLERFSQELQLTPDQKEKVSKIFEEKRTQAMELARSSKAEIQKVLTPEQQAKFEKLEAKWKSRSKFPRRKLAE